VSYIITDYPAFSQRDFVLFIEPHPLNPLSFRERGKYFFRKGLAPLPNTYLQISERKAVNIATFSNFTYRFFELLPLEKGD
jgi:hypothetical protein